MAVELHLLVGNRGGQAAQFAAGFAEAALVEQYAELVAADPRQHVAVAHRTRQAVGHFDQGEIAGGMAETVIDRLQPIDIDIDQHHPVAVAIDAGNALVQRR